MNKGAFGIIGIGVFIFICGYISETNWVMGIAAFIFLCGFTLLTVKGSTSKDPKTGKPYYRCPNCGGIAGEEIPKEKREDGKIYKCKLCNYRW